MTDAPNFATRITALEKAFVDEIRGALGRSDSHPVAISREAAIAITHINTAAAILRDYASREA